MFLTQKFESWQEIFICQWQIFRIDRTLKCFKSYFWRFNWRLSFSNCHSSTCIAVSTSWTKPFLTFKLLNISPLEFLNTFIVENIRTLFTAEKFIITTHIIFTVSTSNLFLLRNQIWQYLRIFTFILVFNFCRNLNFCKVFIFFKLIL